MADQKISALTAASTPLAGTEVLPIVQSSATVKVSVANLTAGRDVSATSIAAGLGLVGTPAYTFTGDLNTGIWSPAADTIAFSEGGVEAMRIDSSGNVGIGTTSPGALLDAQQSANASVVVRAVNANAGASADARLLVSNGPTQSGMIVRGTGHASANQFVLFQASATAPMTFFANGSERMRITSAGNVGIGTSAPGSILDVRTAAGSGPFLTLVNTSATANTNVIETGYTLNNANTGSSMVAVIGATNPFAIGNTYGDIYFKTQNPINGLTEKMRIDSAGNVGIGTAAPVYQLQLSTDSAAKPTSALWTIASDSRIKTETGEYTKGLDAVCALRPITYHYNGVAGFVDDGKENISIIAQEAMQHFPECVGTFEALLNEGDEEKTELFNWNGHALIFALVNAVKELKASNDALVARVNQLEWK